MISNDSSTMQDYSTFVVTAYQIQSLPPNIQSCCVLESICFENCRLNYIISLCMLTRVNPIILVAIICWLKRNGFILKVKEKDYYVWYRL
jgi:hypothetical protein